MAKDYQMYRMSGYVSVWAGEFTKEEDLDGYLRDSFPRDYGVKIDSAAIGEIAVEPAPVEISKLVNGFSRSQTFDKACIDAALRRQISKSSCMFIAYDFKYDEKEMKNPNPPLTFIGAIPYRGFE